MFTTTHCVQVSSTPRNPNERDLVVIGRVFSFPDTSASSLTESMLSMSAFVIWP